MLQQIAILLAAAVIAVPLAKRLGLGAVTGFLLAGVAIGPWALGLIGDVDDVLHFSEFGVVLLLFVIGLELQPSRLWRLRREVFGVGGAQVASTTLVLAAIAVALGQSFAPALIAGFGLAMSSTALVLQLLGEKHELTTRHGRVAFAILLFQDLSIIPFLALVPMLASGGDGPQVGWSEALRVIAVVAVAIGLGRYALRPVFRVLAKANTPEVLTAAALLTVIGFALAMEAAGMSASLGAFMAGVLLADSEYRHELQADIEPFKGMLLGLFFIAVGMSANVGLLLREPLTVLGIVVGLVAIKALLLFAIGRVFGLPSEGSRSLGAAASQGGEFAFVLFTAAVAAKAMSAQLAELLVIAVTVSMMLTPTIYAVQGRWRRAQGHARPYDIIDAAENPVIIAGFGPFGQIVARALRVRKIGFTVLEKNPEHVDFVRRFGNRIFYGDAGRLDLLKAAHADKARYLVLTIPKLEPSIQVAETVRRHFPNLTIYAVAVDRNHAMHLMDMGIKHVIRRSYFSSLEMARELLVDMGDSRERAADTVRRFREHDEATLLKQQAVFRDEGQLIQTSQEAALELEQLFESDRTETDGGAGRGKPV
jgi:monovalent cation:proton antiporter-2 (CPA2) family protein